MALLTILYCIFLTIQGLTKNTSEKIPSSRDMTFSTVPMMHLNRPNPTSSGFEIKPQTDVTDEVMWIFSNFEKLQTHHIIVFAGWQLMANVLNIMCKNSWVTLHPRTVRSIYLPNLQLTKYLSMLLLSIYDTKRHHILVSYIIVDHTP